MSFPRPISVCDGTILNFTREIVADLSEAALVFKDQKGQTSKLVQSAENLYKLARNLGPLKETIDMYIIMYSFPFVLAAIIIYQS